MLVFLISSSCRQLTFLGAELLCVFPLRAVDETLQDVWCGVSERGLVLQLLVVYDSRKVWECLSLVIMWDPGCSAPRDFLYLRVSVFCLESQTAPSVGRWKGERVWSQSRCHSIKQRTFIEKEFPKEGVVTLCRQESVPMLSPSRCLQKHPAWPYIPDWFAAQNDAQTLVNFLRASPLMHFSGLCTLTMPRLGPKHLERLPLAKILSP